MSFCFISIKLFHVKHFNIKYFILKPLCGIITFVTNLQNTTNLVSYLKGTERHG